MSVEKFFGYVDEHQDAFVERLREAVAIPSVSADVDLRPEVFRMADWMVKQLEDLGASTQKLDLGNQEKGGKVIPLPPIVLASFGNDKNKKTILVYGHFDVQPALKEDGWNTEPFELHEDDQGRLIGRGSSDDKGPILGWINVLEAHKKLGLELPVNLKMCFEGMEESGSVGLDEAIYREADKFFADVDCVCISDNYWLGTTKPALTYGLRGVSYFHMKIEGPGRDLHSGVFGGAVHEPMVDLVHLMSKLVSPDGKILIPGIYDEVAPLTEEESATYNNLDFSLDDIHAAIESKNTIHQSSKDALMHRWRYPSLSVHGVEGAFYSSGEKTVIPACVTGKFSIRTVPNMNPEKVTEIVTKFVEQEFERLGSKNKLAITCGHAGPSWVTSPNHWNYVAAAKAVERVYKVKPELTREGGSIPVTLTFQEALKKNVLLLPMGRADDGAHSINEKLDRSNYINGTKLLGAYLYEVAAAQV
ncbi:uncharacterized protein VTP21DRAFT_1793 [Calcarisporiella thermophila]|uniref:uncharacterized protein n=1 Tax=Calcarisporiella thermophila TaxID=911321 RepID=UPI003742D736